MKRFILSLLFVLLCVSVASAQTWYPANQKTIAWDAPTQFINGTPIPAGTILQYRVYTALSTDITKTNAIEMGLVTTGLTYLLTLTQEGNYFVGVKAERMLGGVVVSTSAIAWSDNAAVVPEGKTWGIQFYSPPKEVGGLRTQ